MDDSFDQLMLFHVLWVSQVLLTLLFIGTGIFKLVTPISRLAEVWLWAGEYPNLLRVTGIVDLMGGIGVVLPALTRIIDDPINHAKVLNGMLRNSLG